MDHVFIKSFNTSTKKNTIIDARSIAYDMRRRLKIDPVMLLILHGLSGCDTTSFVKGITKKKFFSTFFNNSTRYNDLIGFASALPPKEAISAAEQLLIDCYSSRSVVQSLDELRANSKSISMHSQLTSSFAKNWITVFLWSRSLLVASHYFKERGRKTIVEKLPPSSTAFYYHCLRASRQIVIWLSSLQSYMNSPAMASSGYQPTEVSDRFKIRWSSLPDFSDDPRLVTCGQCSTGCSRCKCGTSKLSCTIFCQCKDDVCKNRSSVQVCLIRSSLIPLSFPFSRWMPIYKIRANTHSTRVTMILL